MNEPYVPRSPDLSALQPAPSNPPPHPLHSHYASHLSNQPHAGIPSPPPLRQSSRPHDPFALPQPANPHSYQQYSSDPRYTPHTMPRSRKVADPDWLPSNQPYYTYNGVAPYNAQPQASSETPSKPPPGTQEGITVKTKFPVARIKRIVQADEDVGKVAQSTPVAVSKALELFMISLALGSAQCAREKGSKKVSGQHLKAAVSRDEQFDFLNEIAAKIGDGGGGGGGREKKGRETSTSEEREESDEEDGKQRKKRQTGKRRKKEDDD